MRILKFALAMAFLVGCGNSAGQKKDVRNEEVLFNKGVGTDSALAQQLKANKWCGEAGDAEFSIVFRDAGDALMHMKTSGHDYVVWWKMSGKDLFLRWMDGKEQSFPIKEVADAAGGKIVISQSDVTLLHQCE